MEFQRGEPDFFPVFASLQSGTSDFPLDAVDNAGGPRLPSGEPLYELVRDKDGEGWAVREATVSTIPVFDHITFSPWYR